MALSKPQEDLLRAIRLWNQKVDPGKGFALWGEQIKRARALEAAGLVTVKQGLFDPTPKAYLR